MKVKACQHGSHGASGEKRLAHALEEMRTLGIRLTQPRRRILAALAASDRPLSSEETSARIKAGSVDLVTVYRTLTALERAGLVRRHDLGDGFRRYELTDSVEHHHHYVRCQECGQVEAFAGCDFDRIFRNLEHRGYRMIHHRLDVQAVCAHCQ